MKHRRIFNAYLTLRQTCSDVRNMWREFSGRTEEPLASEDLTLPAIPEEPKVKAAGSGE